MRSIWILLLISTHAFGVELSLEAAIERALSRSRQLKIAEIGSEFGQITVLQDAAQMSPKVYLGWDLTHYDSAITFPFNSQTVTVRPQQQSIGFIQAIQPISPLVGLIQKMRADQKTNLSAKASYEWTQIQIAFGAAQAYRQIEQLKQLEEIAKNRVQLVEQRAKEGQAIFEAGRLSKLELLRIQMRVSEAKVAANTMKTQYDIALATFKNLLGFEPEEELTVMPARNANPHPGPLPEGEGDMRVDIKSARLQYEAAQENSWLNIASFFPVLNGFVRADKNFIDPGGFQASTFYSMGFTLTWDLWDGGTRLINLKSASLLKNKANLEYLETSRKAQIDIEQKKLEFKTAQDSLELQKNMLDQGDEAYKAATERFKLGVLTTTDLLQAELDFNNARVAYAKAITDLDIKYMLLQQASGLKRPESLL